MQLRTRVIGAAGIAAVVAAGGSAFTASNTGVPTAKNLGYSSTSVTGAEVSGMAFTVNATDKSKTDAITYTLGNETTNLAPDAVAHVYVGTTAQETAHTLQSYLCANTDYVPAGVDPAPVTPAIPGSIVCDTDAGPGPQLVTADVQVVQLVVQ